MQKELIFQQLFEKESSTYTYLLGDALTHEAVIIDPVVETLDRDLNVITELGLKLKYILETHVHADHITSSGKIRSKTGAKICVNAVYGVQCADIQMNDGDEINFGQHVIKAISTPGHTAGCMTFKLHNMIFTGDALLIRGCGRTDFQNGSSETLFRSIREKIFALPDDTIVYPAHDYKGLTSTTVGDEKKHNPRLNLEVTQDKFVDIMANLNLAYPKKINEALPANLHCGIL